MSKELLVSTLKSLGVTIDESQVYSLDQMDEVVVPLTIRTLTENAKSLNENGRFELCSESSGDLTSFGMRTMNDMLDVRPSYQRGFVWSDKKQKDFIKSIQDGRSANEIQIAVNAEGEGSKTKLELIDGQQRLTTLIKYVSNNIKDIEGNLFGNMHESVQNKFLNRQIRCTFSSYESMDARIAHFKDLNQPNVVLTEQELRNSTYYGTFVDSIKRYFSIPKKYGCVNNPYLDLDETKILSQDLTITAIIWYMTIHNDEMFNYVSSHDYLHTVLEEDPAHGHYLKVINEGVDKLVCDFMLEHRDEDAKFVLDEYRNVANWATSTFNNIKNPVLKSVKNWAYLYRRFKDFNYDHGYLAQEVIRLNKDDELHSKYNIPEYLLEVCRPNCSVYEKYNLSYKLLRWDNPKTPIVEEVLHDMQDCHCAKCNNFVDDKSARGLRKIPWFRGGRADVNNTVVYCPECFSEELSNLESHLREQ